MVPKMWEECNVTDEIEEFFMKAVRAQALAHTGEHFCTKHSVRCEDREILCDDCPAIPAEERT